MKRCGFIAIVGRPNVGKSTLLNSLIGEKISITSNKPQTTRHKILGIKTINDLQAVYIDTPGINIKTNKALNKIMNKLAKQALHDVDVVIFMIEGRTWTKEDQIVANEVAKYAGTKFLVVNKIDQFSQKSELLPKIAELKEKGNFTEIVPISAIKGLNVDVLEQLVLNSLPEGEHYFGKDDLTDQNITSRCSEVIREKLVRNLGQELPYAIFVQIERFLKENNLYKINAIVWVERASHKKIVIGKNGQQLKHISTQARLELEKLLNSKVYLRLWVKVKSNWSGDARHLADMGFNFES